MCIAIFKPCDVPFPTKKTLKICFNNNPDGAGFMYSDGVAVNIRKGFATFSAFWRELQHARDAFGNAPAFVLHFRISTQAGTRPDCTHPFPLSANMDDLRRLATRSSIGIAHNGIISLTSSYSRNITHSDTMEFVTNYLSLIIDAPNYYNDARKLALIERLIGSSRLAILDARGHCELIGDGWREDGGCFYSNGSYKPYKPAYDWSAFGAYLDDDNDDNDDNDGDDSDGLAEAYADYYCDGAYYFDVFNCPATECGCLDFCKKCVNNTECFGE
jgi:hypothetical protein